LAFGAAQRDGEAMAGIDQGHVREGLREVAELAAAHGVVFLGQQPDIIPQIEQAVIEAHGIVQPAAGHEGR
jgi:hypothetical protein